MTKVQEYALMYVDQKGVHKMISITREWKQDKRVEKRGNDSVLSAFFQLVQFELGFGGEVIASSPTKLSVRVRSLMGESATSFSGPHDEMVLLNNVAMCYTDLRANSDEARIQALAPRLVQQGLSKPLFLEMLKPQLLGQHPAKMAAMLTFKIEREEDIMAGIAVSWEDLFAALELVQESG